MIDLQSIKSLQVEATTKCNAWCPGCGRNNQGYNLIPQLELVDLSVSRLQEVLLSLPKLNLIDFCGTFGDAIAAQNICDLVNVAKKH